MMNVEQRPGGLVWAPGQETQWAVGTGPLKAVLKEPEELGGGDGREGAGRGE